MFLLLGALPAWAHVGSPDVYVRGDAGPYTVYVSVHPPVTVPGAAEIDVQSSDAAVTGVDVISGDAGATSLKEFSQEEKFVGSAWVPAGARMWKLRVQVAGSRGTGEMLVPVTLPAVVREQRPWLRSVVLGFAGALLLLAGARIRRKRVTLTELLCGWPGEASRQRKLLAWMLVFDGVILFCLGAWGVAQAAQTRSVTPALQIAMLDGGTMDLKLSRVSGGHALNDLAPDHAHLMHLFLIRLPDMGVVLHLHPVLVSASRDAVEFKETMPPMADGAFAIYADVSHADGVAETATMAAGLPMQVGHPLVGDDSVGVVAHGIGEGCGATSVLADGYRMTLTCPDVLRAKTGLLLRVTLVDAAGNVPADMTNYMGMGGHAAVVSRDGSVFAHIHPMGTVMAFSSTSAMDGMAMPVSNVVEFPYGFPKAGEYRVFVQMKHGAVVETGGFNLAVQ